MWGQPPSAVQGRRPVVFDLAVDLEVLVWVGHSCPTLLTLILVLTLIFPLTFYGAPCRDSSSKAVAVADVNGDGKPDLVVAIFFFNTVGVLLGNGDGTFQAATTYSSGGFFPSSVAVADLNGDAKPDVAVANFCGGNGINCLPGKLGVLLNNTTFSQSTTSTTLVSSLNPSIHGQPITFTATVTTSGPVAPTGTVNFKWGPDGIGQGTLNASGVATFTTSILKPGPYKITAVYKGDASNLASTSAILYQGVKAK